MSTPALTRRALAVSASFVLALGAVGALATAAFADTAPGTTSTQTADAPEAGDPTYTLTNNGAGSFSLAITIPGTSIAVDYTVDPAGTVTGASTSTAGAQVAVDGHDLTITLADGRTVKVELGDAGDAVEEVSVDEQSGDNNQDSQDNTNQDQQDATTNQGADSQDQQGESQDPATTEPSTSSSTQGDSQDTSGHDAGSQDSSSGDSGSGSDN